MSKSQSRSKKKKRRRTQGTGRGQGPSHATQKQTNAIVPSIKSSPVYPPGQGFRALTERWTSERVERVVELLHLQDRDALATYLREEVPQHPHPSDPKDKLDLKGLHFDHLDYRVDLGRVRFEGLNLWSCRLENVNFKDAVFVDCSLGLGAFSEAYLRSVRFEECDLLGCKFEHSILDYVSFERSQLRFVSWTESQIESTAFPPVLEEEKKERWDAARDIYKALRLNLHAIGDEAGASWATYKQCVMERKNHWKKKRRFAWLGSMLMDLLWGYGEKPTRLFFFSLAFCTLCAFGYFTFGITFANTCPSGLTLQDPETYFYRCLYFSFVTFTTLGYGDLAPCSAMSRFLASLEAFSGVFIMGLFVTANVRKLSGR